MSAATKKKHVFLENTNTFDIPNENQSIVQIKGPRGNNLHDVTTPSGETYIVSMPVKFRKSIWTKRGDFVIVEPIEEGNKVKGEIVQVLTKEHIRYLKSQKVWPNEFDINEENSDKKDDVNMFPSSSEEDEEAEEEEEEDKEKN